MNNFVSKCCGGEVCGMCSKESNGVIKIPATHKVGEETFDDDPRLSFHNLTQYVCCKHFQAIMGICFLPFSGTTK
jgi:hypothetical protein